MNRIGIVAGVLLFFAASTSAQQPVISSVFNAASNTPSAHPSGGISQGGMFTVTGSNMGPANVQLATSFPLPTTLAGTSISVTVSGTTTQAIVVLTSASQVSAILRSNTPTGTGTLVLRYNGVASAARTVQVVSATFGIYTRNNEGTGPAFVTNASGQFLDRLNPASPSQTVSIWGTGLGAITGDETQSGSGSVTANVEVLVGSANAAVVSRGRVGAGLDQITFVVPPGQVGCNISIAVKVNNSVSNFASMAVSNGGPCSDPGGLSSEAVQRLEGQGGVRQGTIFLTKTTSTITFPTTTTTVAEFAGGSFTSMDEETYLRLQSSVSIGSCVVTNFSGQTPPAAPAATPLDAGSPIRVNGPNGEKQVPRSSQSPGLYSLDLGTYMGAGSYTITGPGGADVGPFEVSFNIVSPFVWSNSDITTVNRGQNLVITWAGGPTGPNALVVIAGYSAVINSDNSSFGAYYVCLAPADAGQFTVPSTVLLALPASGVISGPGFSIALGNIAVGGYFYTSFTAPGLDYGYAGYTETFQKTLAYE